jgi:hypothetical protein
MRKLAAAWRSGVVAAGGWPGIPPPIRSLGRPGGWRMRPSHRWEAKSADNWQRVHGYRIVRATTGAVICLAAGAARRHLLIGLLAPPIGVLHPDLHGHRGQRIAVVAGSLAGPPRPPLRPHRAAQHRRRGGLSHAPGLNLLGHRVPFGKDGRLRAGLPCLRSAAPGYSACSWIQATVVRLPLRGLRNRRSGRPARRHRLRAAARQRLGRLPSGIAAAHAPCPATTRTGSGRSWPARAQRRRL